MIYPNGHIEVSQLLMMVKSPEYAVYFDQKNSAGHQSDKKQITNVDQLTVALADELLGKGAICYTLTDAYNECHPYAGREAFQIADGSFSWEFHSLNGRHYKIHECSYLGEKPDYAPLEIVLFDGDFNSTCFQIGSWSRKDEGYEFHSCGSRIFDYINGTDLPVIWNAINKADAFLNERFKKEESI